MRTFVVAGSPDARPPAGLAPGPGERVIAADRGALHAAAWGWPVHLLIGDLDSLPAAEAARLAQAGVPTITAPRAKNETDLELAITHAVADGAQEIVICAALGGRTDHMLGNVLLLAHPALQGRQAVLAEGEERLRILAGRGSTTGERAGLVLSGKPGDLLSLLPIRGDAAGVVTAGLLYPLCDETLFFGQTRGVSNVFETAEAHVWLAAGLLLVVHTSVAAEDEPENGSPESKR